MPIEKNDEAITTKLPSAMKEQVIKLAKQEGVSPSVFVRKLIEADIESRYSMFKSLEEVFKDSNGNKVSMVSEVSDEGRASFLRIADASKAEGYSAEGVIVYYSATKRYEKYTFKTPQGKWAA